MFVNGKVPSFKEYYLVEEGKLDDFIDKFKNWFEKFANDIINNNITKNEIEKTTKKIENIISNLNTSIKDKITDLFKKYVIDPLTQLTEKRPYLKSITAILIASLGLSGAYHLQKSREQQTPSIEYNVETPPSERTIQQSEKLTSELTKELNYGRFVGREKLVDMVKVYEAGDYKNPNKIPKPLKAYFDRTQTSIGYGTKAKEGETRLSTAEAHDRLIDELSINEEEILKFLKERKIKKQYTKEQIFGMTDFAFNRGINKFKQLFVSSNNLKELGDKMKKEVGARTSNLDKPIFSPNLENRRGWEVDLMSGKIKI